MTQLTISQLQERLLASLPPEAMDRPADQRAELVRMAAAQLVTSPAIEYERRVDDALFNSKVAYAVPDDALNLFPSIVQAVVGAFAKGPVGALADVVGLLVRYSTLKVKLTAEEAAA